MKNTEYLSNSQENYKELNKSETNFRVFFESVDHLLIVSDLEGNIRHCNKSFINKVGYSLAELKNMNSIELHPLDKREETYNIIRRLVKKEIKYAALDIQAKTGELYSLETKIWLGKWDGQDALFSTSKDITKENENLQLFSKIFENNPLPISISSIEDNKFIKINPAFREIIGFTEEEALGMTIEDLNIFIDFNEFNGLKDNLLKNESIKNKEILLRSRQGKFIIGKFSLELIKNQGTTSLLTVMVDVTKEKENSAELERFFSLNLDLLCITEINGNFIKVNKAWEDILGYTSDHL